MLCAFLRTRKWSFLDKRGREIFSGLEMTWTFILAALLLLRARSHRQQLESETPAAWALSGSVDSQARASALTIHLSDDEFRDILLSLHDYLDKAGTQARHPGVPPALSYSFFTSRMEYVWSLVSYVPGMMELFETVQRMVRCFVIFPL